MKKYIMILVLTVLYLQSIAAGGAKDVEVNTVEYVDLKRFSGEWLVAALIPSPIEKKAQRGVETYTVKDNGNIDIQYSYYKRTKPDKQKIMTQKGHVIDKESNAHWKISPLWPLKFNYYILELAEDYSYTVIGTDSKNYLWIMVRRDAYGDFDLDSVIRSQIEKGYDGSKIIKMDQ